MENTEKRFQYEGVWFIAVKEESCRCCAFSDGKKCSANDEIVPACSEFKRKDKLSVIFVESDVDNQGGEE